ncbi:MAG: TonB-dependent receptor [Acidobacteriota bacterium]
MNTRPRDARIRLRALIRTMAATAILLPLASAPSVAQSAAADSPSVVFGDDVTVTGSRVPLTAEQRGSRITVITAEEIAQRQTADVADLLRTVPGLAVVRTGGPGQITSVFMRGANSSQALILIDGVPLNSTTAGGYDLSNLRADAIDRIEIVRGPQSTLYGSDAIGGVIQIHTRRSETPVSLQLDAEVGEDDRRRIGASIELARERFDLLLSLSDEEDDAVSAAAEDNGNTEVDPYDLTTAIGRLGIALHEHVRAELFLRAADGTTGVDGFSFGIGPVDDPNAILDRESQLGAITLTVEPPDGWHARLRLSAADDELVGRDPDNFFSNFTVESELRQAELQLDRQLTDLGTAATFGGSYETREGGSVGSFDEEIDITAFFAQFHWAWAEESAVTLGARYDDHSRFGEEVTYRLALAHALAPWARLHATVGTGFKAPTLNDLFFPGFSNPDLDAETSLGYDVGITFGRPDGVFDLDLTYFANDFEDLIAFEFATVRPENIAEAESSCVELVSRWTPSPRASLQFGYTYTDTEDKATGAQLARRPEQKTSLSVFVEPLADLRTSLTVVSEQDRIDSDGSEMDDIVRVDLALGYRGLPTFGGVALEPYVRVENLLDADDAEVPGFTTPGRRVAVGIRLGR